MWFIFHWLEINGRSKLQPFPYTHEGFQAGNLREITPKRQNLRDHSRRSSLNHWFSRRSRFISAALTTVFCSIPGPPSVRQSRL
jgi:hypothetical protein